MSSHSLKKSHKHLKQVEEVIEKEHAASSSSPNMRSALRETTSRLNIPLPMCSLLQTLPEQRQDEEGDNLCLQRGIIGTEQGSSEGGGDDSTVFGFMTPSKRRGRQSLLQIAIASSSQKKQQQHLQELEKSPPSRLEDIPEEKHNTTPTRQSTRSPQKTPKRDTPTKATATTPTTPKQRAGATLLTPKCVPKASRESPTTPRTRRSLAPQLEVVEEPRTPREVRTRIRTRLVAVTYHDSSSGSDSEEDDYGDEDYHDEINSPVKKRSTVSSSTLPCESGDEHESGDEDETGEDGATEEGGAGEDTEEEDPTIEVKDKKKRASPRGETIKGQRRKKLRPEEEETTATTDYFLHNDGSSNIVTSDHTLSKLSVPRLSAEVLRALMSQSCSDHRAERRELYADHVEGFGRWRALLGYGFSIFVHGVGSKKKLLSQFQEEFLADTDHVVVNGFFPSLTIKSILGSILEQILCYDTVPQSAPEQLEMLYRHYRRPAAAPLYLLVHNIDGPMLRSSTVQRSLSHLCSLPNVRLLASVDHINAPLLLDTRSLSEYNVVWFDCTTLAPYTEETSYENSLMVQQSSTLALSSLIHVFKSLTPSSKGIYLLLASYQLETQQDHSYTGMTFADLYQRCRERMFATSDLTLRAQLTEFTDHKLLRQRKGQDGAEVLLIPLDAATLREFVDQQQGEEY